MIDLYNGDCLEVMDKLIEKGVKVDSIICDPPYGTTVCKWDSVIPFNKYIITQTKKGKDKIMYRDEYILDRIKIGDEYNSICEYFDNNAKEGMWQKLNKIIKPNGAIVLFGSEPFSAKLRNSNIKQFKYDWVWQKNAGSNFATVKYQPFKEHENILIFGDGRTQYYPIMQERAESGKNRVKSKVKPNSVQYDGVYGKMNTIPHKMMKELRYPSSIQKFNRERGLHPTQKPVALMEYLIKTYTNENGTVLDFTMGSGTTGVACVQTNRNFIGIELDENYFEIATKRINETKAITQDEYQIDNFNIFNI